MPELPEVETTRRGIAPYLKNRRIAAITIRQRKLRWPIPEGIEQLLPGQKCSDVGRRGKYLLLDFDCGTLLIHLGMSGSLRVLEQEVPPGKHDHVDILLDSGSSLRFRDPRRFGAVLWHQGEIYEHPLLSRLGPEPLSADFTFEDFWQRSRGRRKPVKNFIMDSTVVVGIGNIYACEALFLAGIHPNARLDRLKRQRMEALHHYCMDVLEKAVAAGGTTLKDFTSADGSPGYFSQQLHVYGREGQICGQCGDEIKRLVIQGRSSFFCPSCQRK